MTNSPDREKYKCILIISIFKNNKISDLFGKIMINLKLKNPEKYFFKINCSEPIMFQINNKLNINN